MSELQITLSAMQAGQDPAITVYHVELQQEGIWTETFGTQEALMAFLRGVQAAHGVAGRMLRIPEIPAPGETTVSMAEPAPLVVPATDSRPPSGFFG